RRKEILDTLVQGAREGFFVLRRPATDRTARTFWRQEPDEEALRDPALEVVLPETAELAALPPALLLPGALPGLWPGEELPVPAAFDYFTGGHVVQVHHEGYDEPVLLPRADRAVVEKALCEAVQAGQVWLLAGQASLCGEPVPPGLLGAGALLCRPPAP